MSEEDLPAAHPVFAAHFTADIYDPDDYRNDDLPPFGTDEGSDAIHEWAERIEEMQQHPTLRHLLGDTAEDWIADLERSEQGGVDDILIGTGFTLLRFTGEIDGEGRSWLLQALERQNRRDPGAAYATMLEDLTSFDQPAGGASEERRRRKPGKTKPWLWITGLNDKQIEARFARTARAVADDPHWRAWWTGSGLDFLDLCPRPIGPPGDHTIFHPNGKRLMVTGTSSELTEITTVLHESRGSRPTITVEPRSAPLRSSSCTGH